MDNRPERIPFNVDIFNLGKRLRTLGGAVIHLFTRQLGDQPLAPHGDHFIQDDEAIIDEVFDGQVGFTWDSDETLDRDEPYGNATN